MIYRYAPFSEPRPIAYEATLQSENAEPLSKAVEIVVASQKSDDTTWLNALADWPRAIYVTDDRRAALKVPKNKGREGMVYLTYIIDHYDQLPNVAVFSHSKRYQWHNDDPLYDGLSVLSRLNLSHVESLGYTNLRCVWSVGCPDEIEPMVEAALPPPASDPKSNDARAGSFYKAAFEQMFPNVTVPETVGAPCCAQFAVTAAKIRERPKADYERVRDWLLETPLRDSLSGRVLEYMWHVIFGQKAVHCPDPTECYCKLYGICGVSCDFFGQCEGVFTMPSYASLPKGWPDYDWEDKWQNATDIRRKFEETFGLSESVSI
ncbi:hypothetical protein CERZMDRAFT_67553 [Cercospora zeae-maydis SCOH1-5]|uniref:Uncharacterized protein n=1 Tax=Cercospora zeae-maydis SCOH1-5 TaxID=717836 RepID=A0A6A6FIM9_9PEZI|nr:hypothetical protein CERZMDRAFT_67553 [Cercospora zeae-maydis SCOH1-5]